MSFIKKLKLSQKLILLALVPTLIMLAFAIFQSFQAVTLLSGSKQLSKMVEFSVVASDLVHELQKERGMSAGYLGSRGGKFRDAIVEQREVTNEKNQTLQLFLKEFDQRNMGKIFSTRLDETLQQLEQLTSQRELITKLTMPLKDALAYYTGMNTMLLKLIEQMSILAPDQDMAIKISAYANFLQSKERAGIERAVLANAFSKGAFADGMFNKFLGLVTIQQIYSSVFLSLANEADKAFYENAISNDSIKETNKMREIAISAAKRTKLVNELNKSMGYGGLIHRYKNYILHGNFLDQTLVVISAKNAIAVLNDYEKLPGVNDKIKSDIATIKDVINQYKDAASKASDLRSSTDTSAKLDSALNIKNGAAFEAIKRLGQGRFGIDPTYWFKKQTEKINILKVVENHLSEELATTAVHLKTESTFSLIVTVLLSLMGLAISIILGIYIGRNLRQQIGGEPSDIEEIAKQIASGSLKPSNNQMQPTGIYAAILSLQKQLSEVIEKEIQGIVNAARQGDLSKRVETTSKEGFYKSLGEGINDLVDSSESIISDTGRVFSSLSQGDLKQTITREYHGSFNQLKNDANATINTLSKVIEGDIQTLVNASLAGDLSQRIELSDKLGFFHTMSLGINQLVDSVDSIFDDASNAMDSLAHGDLTKPINQAYVGQFEVLKNNINETMFNLQQTITGLRDSSNIVNHTSAEISDGNNSLSERTEHQASAIEETAASMEELTSTVKNNADNTYQANELSNNAKETVLKGKDVMQQASVAMEEINSSSQKIAEIIGVIDEIAFQTNLLALNASVEAARAGEQGRGFAVVATEVRNLAGRSATAAKEIKELINDSVDKVGVGVQLVEQSTVNQNQVVESINKVGSIISEISAASHEQSEGINQVNMAVTSLDDTTQQNAALAEQTSAAASSLKDHAQEMSDMMDFFTVSDENNS